MNENIVGPRRRLVIYAGFVFTDPHGDRHLFTASVPQETIELMNETRASLRSNRFSPISMEFAARIDCVRTHTRVTPKDWDGDVITWVMARETAPVIPPDTFGVPKITAATINIDAAGNVRWSMHLKHLNETFPVSSPLVSQVTIVRQLTSATGGVNNRVHR